jgi:hypothetical protein
MSFKHTHWSALTWLLITSIAAAPIHAQEKETTLALVKSLPDSTATATIVREPGANGRTIILVPEATADALTLATAFSSLARSRQADAGPLRNQVVITLHGLRSLSSLTADEHRAADDYVSRLQNAQWQELAGFGLAKMLVIPVPRL